MSLYQKFIQNERLRRFCVLALIIFVLYLSRSMITTILLTFIFTYLAVRLVHFVQRYMKIPTIVIVLLTYALVVFLIYLAITKYVPVLVNQTTQMINSVVDFYQSPHTDTNQVLQFIDQYLEKSNLLSQLQNGASMILRYIQDIGAVGLSFVMSFILSFFFMMGYLVFSLSWYIHAIDPGTPHMRAATYSAFLYREGVAVLKNAKNRDLAVEFVKFALSKEGQDLVDPYNYMLPVRPDAVVENNKGLPQPQTVVVYNPALGSKADEWRLRWQREIASG